MFLFEQYHQNSKHYGQQPSLLTKPSEWPAEWKTKFIKTYPRFKSYALPAPVLPPTTLESLLENRVSYRSFTHQLALEQLSALLYFSIGQKEGSEKRRHPSAGALYPLEYYLIIKRTMGAIEPGLYHYDIEKHALTLVEKKMFTAEELQALSLDSYILDCDLAIAFTAVFSRITSKYGERAYRFALLEAGAAAQNFTLCAEALGLSSLNLGGAIDKKLEAVLDVDGIDESLVHVMCFG